MSAANGENPPRKAFSANSFAGTPPDTLPASPASDAAEGVADPVEQASLIKPVAIGEGAQPVVVPETGPKTLGGGKREKKPFVSAESLALKGAAQDVLFTIAEHLRATVEDVGRDERYVKGLGSYTTYIQALAAFDNAKTDEEREQKRPRLDQKRKAFNNEMARFARSTGYTEPIAEVPAELPQAQKDQDAALVPTVDAEAVPIPAPARSETKAPLDKSLSPRIKETDRQEIVTMRNAAYEAIMNMADAMRRAGKNPGEGASWPALYKDYADLSDLLDAYGEIPQGKSIEEAVEKINGQLEVLERELMRARSDLAGSVAPDVELPTDEIDLPRLAPAEDETDQDKGVGDDMESAELVKPLAADAGSQGEMNAEAKAKLRDVIDQLGEIAYNPHDGWSPAKFEEYQRTGKGVKPDEETLAVAAAPTPAAVNSPLEIPSEEYGAYGFSEKGPEADVKKEEKPEQQAKELTPEEKAAADAAYARGEGPNRYPVPMVVPQPGEEGKEKAMTIGEQLAQYTGDRNGRLDKEAEQKFGEGSGVMNWLRRKGEAYNKWPLAGKLLLGGALMGAAAFGMTLGMPAIVATVGLTAWRAFTSFSAGLGAYTTAEALIQRSKEKKLANGKELGFMTKNKKKWALGIGIGAGLGTFLLGEYMTGAFNGMFGHGGGVGVPGPVEHLPVPGIEHHFDPNAMVEVRPGHGAISMVHDLQAKLDHLYAHTPQHDIPPAAREIMTGDPTKIAEQLHAYNPDAFNNSELVLKHAHLGLGANHELIFSAHGMESPVTLMNPDGTPVPNWGDHMMHPHGHVAGHHGAGESLQDREMDMSINSQGDMVPDGSGAGHPATQMGGAERIASDWHGQSAHGIEAGSGTSHVETVGASLSPDHSWALHHDPSALHELMGNAHNMQPNAEVASAAAQSTEPGAYLLQDGRVSVFGANTSVPEAYAKIQEGFAQTFAHDNKVDIVLTRMTGGGSAIDMIIHPDGPPTFAAPAASVPLIQEVVMKL